MLKNQLVIVLVTVCCGGGLMLLRMLKIILSINEVKADWIDFI